MVTPETHAQGSTWSFVTVFRAHYHKIRQQVGELQVEQNAEPTRTNYKVLLKKLRFPLRSQLQHTVKVTEQ